MLRKTAASSRLHVPDLACTALLFICVSFSAGRVGRFPFDDEIYTLSLVKRVSAHTFAALFDDVHPPLAYALFCGLHQLGLSDSSLRLCSLIMTALALLLFQFLTLTWIEWRNPNARALPTRLTAVLMFGLSPLAVSQGDALRWYPLFALLTALFVALYTAPRGSTAQLCSAAMFGLAGSTNFLAGLLIPPFVLYRYGLQRQFRPSFDAAFWLIAAAGAAPGLYSAYLLLAHRLAAAHSQFGAVAQAVLVDTLGFFGGDALGVSQAWLLAPAVIIVVIAAACAIDSKEPGKPVHLLLLLLGSSALMAVAGFSKPRSFLYLAPMIAALLTLFFDRQVQQGRAVRTLALVSLLLAPMVAAIANIDSGAHPFKRNSVIPYRSIMDFIHGNETGSVLVVSTDPVVPYLLRETDKAHCAGYFLAAVACLTAGQRYDSIFVITGHSDKSTNSVLMQKFDTLVADLTTGRAKAATLPAGLDEDAALKTRLTGVPLDRYILRIDLYR